MARVPKSPPTWREQYDRMLRWSERIHARREPDVDECYAFFTCCYHLRDWLRNDPAVPVPGIREEVEKLFDRVTGELELKLAADLTTGLKHVTVTQTPRLSERVGRGEVPAGSPGPPGLGIGRRRRVLVVQAGDSTHEVRQVIDRCLEIWERFLSKHSLITP